MTRQIDDLQALATEVAALYSDRFGTPQDAGWALAKMTEELGEVAGAYLALQGQSRKAGSTEALADEIGDLFGFLLVFAARAGIDPSEALVRKWGAYLPEKDDVG